MKISTTHAVVCAAVISLIGMQASAAVMTYSGEALSAQFKINCTGTLANGQTVAAGQMKINYLGEDLLGYCVDLDHYSATTEVTERSASTLTNGWMVAYLFNTYAPAVATAVDAAALQTALWEVINETGSVFNVTSGHFFITNNASVATAANNLLASIPASYSPSVWPIVLDSVDKQDILIQGRIPEPATISMLLLGSLGVFMRRLNRHHVA
ncbi:MAG: PEP-CTERM sorting domain-containing protein [Planctomycetaceae bacterium]|nr:PEP-CTERM sorting domain-containing protein [Planctomycetaceae bacterium]